MDSSFQERDGFSLHGDCALAPLLAERLRESRRDVTGHWLERIAARVSADRNRIFPTDDLLDHVPLLINGIADYLENPAAEVGGDSPVVGKAMELGALRHDQGFDAYEILKEYEILGGILFTFLARAAQEIDAPCEKSELLICGHRVFRAVSIIQQATTAHFLRLADEKVNERETRLRAFNRSVSHEIKNQIGTILGASDVMREIPTMGEEQRAKLLAIIGDNARFMRTTIENLLSLSRLDNDARQHRHIKLAEAAAESVRQMRERAQSQGVMVELLRMPDVEVNAAVIELSLNNLISNAIKYADPAKPQRRVTISGSIETKVGDAPRRLVVRVADNGLGVPVDKRSRLFEKFFRAHETVTGAEGTGLGLSIVRETVEGAGGEAWAEFPEEGTVFAFALPCRRVTNERRAVDGGDGRV